jgi:hypothetical protein
VARLVHVEVQQRRIGDGIPGGPRGMDGDHAVEGVGRPHGPNHVRPACFLHRRFFSRVLGAVEGHATAGPKRGHLDRAALRGLEPQIEGDFLKGVAVVVAGREGDLDHHVGLAMDRD